MGRARRRAAVRDQQRATRAYLNGASSRKVNAYLDRAGDYMDQAERYARKAVAALRRAGVDAEY